MRGGVTFGSRFDLGYSVTIEMNSIDTVNEVALAGNKNRQLGVECLSNLPKHMERGALPSFLDIHNRDATQVQPLCEGRLRHLVAQPRLANALEELREEWQRLRSRWRNNDDS
jgi:hypothetical protein